MAPNRAGNYVLMLRRDGARELAKLAGMYPETLAWLERVGKHAEAARAGGAAFITVEATPEQWAECLRRSRQFRALDIVSRAIETQLAADNGE